MEYILAYSNPDSTNLEILVFVGDEYAVVNHLFNVVSAGAPYLSGMVVGTFEDLDDYMSDMDLHYGGVSAFTISDMQGNIIISR